MPGNATLTGPAPVTRRQVAARTADSCSPLRASRRRSTSSVPPTRSRFETTAHATAPNNTASRRRSRHSSAARARQNAGSTSAQKCGLLDCGDSKSISVSTRPNSSAEGVGTAARGSTGALSSRLLRERLGWPEGSIDTTFQSVFGTEEWLRPYTVEHVAELAKRGITDIAVISPAFSADCIETLEEINGEIREAFEHAGGQQFTYVPCLNDDDAHIAVLTAVIAENMAGWA